MSLYIILVIKSLSVIDRLFAVRASVMDAIFIFNLDNLKQ